MPQISVIVPVYKVEKYLHRCVDSILAQTFSDFELILVDDGSPDGCGAICDAYAQMDSRVVVIHQKNGGLSAARNAGIDWAFANSDSEWLAFVDSDDWVHPSFLHTMYHSAVSCASKMAICNLQVMTSYGVNDLRNSQPTIVSGIDFLLINNTAGIVAWNKLYKKTLFADIRYPVGKIHEDDFTTPRLLYIAESAAWIDEILYYYFKNENGIMHSEWSTKRLDGLDAEISKALFYEEIGREEAKRDRVKCYFSRAYRFMRQVEKDGRDDAAKNLKLLCAYIRKGRKLFKDEFKAIFNKYDRLTYWLLSLGFPSICRWVIANEFEPIQIILGKIKKF